MKVRVLFFVLIIPIAFGLTSFELPKNIFKKVSKTIKTIYEVEEFSLEIITFSDEINTKLKTKIGNENLFKITNDSTLIGYAFIGKAPSKTDEFDYLVLFDTDLIITKSKVLVYHEDHGAEIGSSRWLKQFIGKNKTTDLKYGRDIAAIAGATISARSMTIAVNNLLKTVAFLDENELL